ncbi:hypothetical protein NPIL_275661 [Nephila pilipes]|uniref:Uncharacterized protein n=1 Tax=Nephila pilipes TaxID=299642 RepID=A0A8X6Q6D0_NEPPI|nr:hypothetical protein NPIL_275661 [Nephila pilipes]
MIKIVIFIFALVAIAACSLEVLPSYSYYGGISHHGNGISNRYLTKTEGLGYGIRYGPYGLEYDRYGLRYGRYDPYDLGYGYRLGYGYNGLGYF